MIKPGQTIFNYSILLSPNITFFDLLTKIFHHKKVANKNIML